MPKGVFTGFKIENGDFGLILLLKNKQNNLFELVYIDKNSKSVLNNQKDILNFLSLYQDNKRVVDKKIDNADKTTLQNLYNIIRKYIDSLTIKQDSDTKKAGEKTIDFLNSLKMGQKEAKQRIKKNKTIEEEFDIKNYELIVWFVVS